MSQVHTPVVVGVDGSADALRAVRYAALRAQKNGSAVDIVHVAPRFHAVPPLRPVVPPAWPEVGLGVLHEAAEVAREVTPDCSVHTRLLTGSRAHELLAAAEHATMLVLGAEHAAGHDRIVTSATTVGVVSHTDKPVVVVPPEWSADRHHGRVVVGFQDADRAGGPLEAGFVAAAAEGAELVILHAWRMVGIYDDVVGARVDAVDRHQRTELVVEPLIAGLRALHPEVRVLVLVPHAQPARALVDASKEADLLVLGHPGPGLRLGHLGATARAVLRLAECPVEFLPEVEVALPSTDLVLEDAGATNR